MFSIDDYLQRKFDMKSYNCWHMAKEAWQELTSEVLQSRDIGNFVRLTKPQAPCFVLMQKKNAVPHVGIFYNGKVLHLHPVRNACYEPVFLASIGFHETDYYVTRTYADRTHRQESARPL